LEFIVADTRLKTALDEMKDRAPQTPKDLANWKERLTMAAFDDAAKTGGT